MVYISTLIHTPGKGLAGVGREWGRSFIRRFSMFWIGRVFMFYIRERDLLSGYLQYWPHDVLAGDTLGIVLSWIQNVHFAFPPAPSVFLPPTPESPRRKCVDLPLVTEEYLQECIVTVLP